MLLKIATPDETGLARETDMCRHSVISRLTSSCDAHHAQTATYPAGSIGDAHPVPVTVAHASIIDL